ncbi:MAG: aldehyde dehydrogenase [Sphingomonadales bacterium]|nr:aldehyde dehydrogenase [Sphingomonadales bacterium]
MTAPNRTVAIRHPRSFFIGGEWAAPSSDAVIEVLDSATETPFLVVAEAQAADIGRAVTAARHAFDHGPWPRLTPQERAVTLNRIAELYTTYADAFADSWTMESGTIRRMSAHTAAGTAQTFRYYAGLADTFDWHERHTAQFGEPALLVREPVGVVGAIIPWNAPNMLMAYKAAPALLAGCTLIIKASPEAPSAPYLFAQICEEAGVPPGVVNVLTADREVSELLVRDPRVDKISFTGSTAAGRKIGSIMGGRVGRCTLELGGKSPAVVLDDADLGMVAAKLAGSAPVMTGQVCASLTRVVVGRDRHDALVDALAGSFSQITVGDPFDEATRMGPLAMARQLDRVESYIAAGQADGARLATGGGRPAHLNRGYFIEPTVFGNVSNDSRIAREEIFGPVISVIPARDEAEAIAIANDSEYGLNASVFTSDPERAWAVGRQLRSGTVGVNGFKTDFTIAFGGYKQSGIGREGGVEGLRLFLESKTMIFDTMPASLA